MIKYQIRKGKKKAIEVARETAKQVAGELAEIPKQTIKEVTGTKGSDSSPIVEAMQQKTYTDGSGGEQDVETPVKKLDYLEKELEELRVKNRLEKQRKDELLRQEKLEKEEQPQVLIEPPTKKKPGLPIFGKKKSKGTGEMLKSKK